MQFAAHGAVLVAGPDNRAHAHLHAMLDLAGYRALTGRTVRQSIGLLNAVRVVICEDVLPDGTWKDILAALDQVHSPPALIVTSAVVGARLWAEVLNLGGSDVLAQPFSNEEVLWSVQYARPVERLLPNPDSHLELPENGHRCALLGTDRLAAGEEPWVSHLKHCSEAPSGWPGACSLNRGAQRSIFQRDELRRVR